MIYLIQNRNHIILQSFLFSLHNIFGCTTNSPQILIPRDRLSFRNMHDGSLRFSDDICSENHTLYHNFISASATSVEHRLEICLVFFCSPPHWKSFHIPNIIFKYFGITFQPSNKFSGPQWHISIKSTYRDIISLLSCIPLQCAHWYGIDGPSPRKIF